MCNSCTFSMFKINCIAWTLQILLNLVTFFEKSLLFRVSKRKHSESTETEDVGNVLVQFKSESGELLESPIDLPFNVTTENLQAICNALIKKSEDDETTSYTFFVHDKEITSTLNGTLAGEKIESEKVLEIIYQPQAVFRVRAVTRCTSSLPGHSEAVVSASFSPDGKNLASGSGDKTVRFWDLNTENPLFTCTGKVIILLNKGVDCYFSFS